MVVYIYPYERIKHRQYFLYVYQYYCMFSFMIFYYERLYHYLYFFFSLFVYFQIYLYLYLCLIFSPILYGRVAHDIVYFNCLHGVGDVLLTTDSYFSMQGSLFFIFFHDSTCALFLLGFSPIHSLFFLFLFDISFFYFFISFALFVSTFYYTLCLFPTFTFFFHLHNLPSKGDPAFPLPLMFLTPFFEYRWLCPPFYRFTLKSRNLSIFSTSYFNSFPCLQAALCNFLQFLT